MTAIMASTVGVRTMADGTLRLTIEIEPRHAVDAFTLFGAPGVPCGIARLTNDAAVEAMREQPGSLQGNSGEDKAKGGPLAKLSGIWCNDSAFWAWIHSQGCPSVYDANAAANWVRTTCGIESRAELDADGAAAVRFHKKIREPYSAYLREVA